MWYLFSIFIGFICLLGFYKFDIISFLVIFSFGAMLFLCIRQLEHLTFNWLKCVGSILIAAFWLASTYLGNLSSHTIISFIYILGAFYFLTNLFYLLLLELAHPFSPLVKSRIKKYELAIYAGIPFVSWMFSFLAYFPAKMTFDSYYQWAMAHDVRQYSAWHPLLHTLWVEFTSNIYNSPASYIFTQIVVVALIVGYAIYSLTKLGLPKFLGYLLVFGYALWPVMMLYSVTAWKDIPFAAFILLFTTLLAKIVASNGTWLKKPLNLTALILVAFVTINLRNNGVFIVVVTLLLLVIFMKGFRIRTGLVFVIVMAMNLLFNGPVANALNVQQNPLNQALAIPSQQIGATFYYNGQFTKELKDYFTEILPEENWKKDYNPYTVDPIKHDAAYNSAPIDADFGLYIKNWAKLMTDNFGIYVKSYLDQTSAIWRYQSPDNYSVFFGSTAKLQDINYDIRTFAIMTNTPNDVEKVNRAGYERYMNELKSVGVDSNLSYEDYIKNSVEPSAKPLYSDSKFTSYDNFLNQLMEKVRTDWQNILLKGAIPLLLLLIAFVSNLGRGRRLSWLLFVPAFLAVATIAVAMPATDFRYSFSFIFTVPFLFFVAKLNLEKN